MYYRERALDNPESVGEISPRPDPPTARARQRPASQVSATVTPNLLSTSPQLRERHTFPLCLLSVYKSTHVSHITRTGNGPELSRPTDFSPFVNTICHRPTPRLTSRASQVWEAREKLGRTLQPMRCTLPDGCHAAMRCLDEPIKRLTSFYLRYVGARNFSFGSTACVTCL